jgi:ABC-type branched-subunit amino acid transport system substrate-binding protein
MPRCAAALALLACVLIAGACGGGKSAQPVTNANCEPIYYEGDGSPDALIVSDLPRKGDLFRKTTSAMVDSIKFALRRRGFRAGDLRIGYQSCDDTVGDIFDEAVCAADARSYAADSDVLGVIGTYNSACTISMLPILSRRSAGPLVMISPSNTYVGLTRKGAGVCCGHPGVLYPDGIRNYVRVTAPDDVQGAAGAVVAHDEGARRAVVLILRTEDYAVALAASFVRAARAQGMEVTTLDYASRPSFKALVRRVAPRQPDAVYIAGLPQANGLGLVRDLRSALGGDPLIVTPDGFLGLARDMGAVGEGMLVTHVGVPVERLPPAGVRFVRGLGAPIAMLRDRWVPESGQSADVLLDAISRSDGTRGSVTEELRSARVENGILGSFHFDANGDVDPAIFSLYRFTDRREQLLGTIPVPGDLSR